MILIKFTIGLSYFFMCIFLFIKKNYHLQIKLSSNSFVFTLDLRSNFNFKKKTIKI